MKTRIALMFTASVVTISSASSADADFRQASNDAGTPSVATDDDATAFGAQPLVLADSTPRAAVPVSRDVPVTVAGFEPRIERLIADLPVEVGSAAAPFVAAVSVSDIADVVGASQPAIALPALTELELPIVEAVAFDVPVVEATALAPVQIPPTVGAVAAPVADIQPAAAAPLQVPAAPNYVFFEDAASGPAPAVSAAAAAAGMVYSSENVTLEQAISAALETNPEINQAIMNKEAIEFEREQAQGLYLPRVDIDASAGVRRLENNTRRTLGIANQELYPLEAGISAEWTMVDFGRRHGELMRQAARTDGAALRVGERSENVALLVTRQYLNILLQQRVVAAAEDNVTFHRNLVRDLGQGVQQGSISIADQQQAQERMQAAIVRKAEAEESLVNAQITLQTLTGLSVNSVTLPGSKRAAVAPTINDAIAQARQENPKVLEAMADVDAAHAMIEKANGDLHPTIGVEARGRVGDDIDGFRGETNDMQARVVLKWNIFDGGINRAKYQEMVRRASEARFRLHELVRYAEEDVRTAWNSMSTQDKVGQELEVQSRVSDDLLLSYREQFNVGRRSLLDVLDAQNTRYNVQVRLETARFAEQFAEYQVLAATNNLLESLQLKAPSGSEAYAREKYNYGPSAPAETDRRRYPR
jgi:outer membrane protein, adhesin transport system